MKGYYISGFSVPRMIQVKAMHGVSGQEEVMELFVVTGGAECAMLLRLQAQLEEPAAFRVKSHPGTAGGPYP